MKDLGLKQRLSGIKWQGIIFNLVSIIIAAKICKRFVQILMRLELQNLQSTYLWKCFIISLVTYLIILFLSLAYSKLFKILSAPILYIGFLFLLYFLTLLNLLVFKIADTFFIQFCVVILLIPIVYRVITNKSKVKLLPIKNYRFTMVDILIFAWLVHSFFYFFEYNFNLQRIAYGDETGLWFIASKNMVMLNVLKGHLAGYPGGEVHSLGIPFISVLPAKLSGTHFTETIFFMPIVIIITLFLFLCQIRSKRWCFLFFYLALFGAFNNLSWIGQLCYRVIYGEGICMVFFLLVTYEIKKLTDQPNIRTIDLILMSFCIGLLSLSKSPLSYFTFLFSIIFIVLFNLKYKMRPNRLSLSLLALIISVVPFFIWKLFTFVYNINLNPFYNAIYAAVVQHNFFQINFTMLKNVISDLSANCPDAIYFSILSLAFILMAFRKIEFIHLVPIVCLVFSVFLYYGYIYGGADSGSSMRYMMPQALALFYLGAVGFRRVVKAIAIDKQKRYRSIRFPLIFALIILLIINMF